MLGRFGLCAVVGICAALLPRITKDYHNAPDAA
jgi:hypothetical protein